MCTDDTTSPQRFPAYALSELSLKHNATQIENGMLVNSNSFMNVFVGREQ